jgi:hypothetical protein
MPICDADLVMRNDVRGEMSQDIIGFKEDDRHIRHTILQDWHKIGRRQITEKNMYLLIMFFYVLNEDSLLLSV